jgi:hypothetical protein
MLKHSLIALAAMGAGLIGFSASEASAFTIQKPAIVSDAASSLRVDVRSRCRDGKCYNNYHHDRRRYRSHRYRHYHGGYWYDNPWWVLPMVGAGIALSNRGNYYDDGYGSNHVEWCLSRYRSYNVRTNTWVSYSGRVHQCVSPYGP